MVYMIYKTLPDRSGARFTWYEITLIFGETLGINYM